MKDIDNKIISEIKQYGRMLDTIITYEINGEEHLLDSDVLYSVNPHFNSDLLKSVMKELDIESAVEIPKGTLLNIKLGVLVDLSITVAELTKMKMDRFDKTPMNLLSKGLKGFKYIDFGNYIVSKDPEYNADTLSYTHKCYDKMLYSMKNYEDMNLTFPLTVREYIKKICNHLGLTFANRNDTFANYNRQITADYYLGYDYTFRDVLDELAQVTASNICINANDELEIRYISQESVIEIDEDYFKESNVTFEDVSYGPINSIVLSRSGESDNVYKRNESSVSANGLCELKIIDNQIMNYNDRSNYLPDILAKLNGLTYCINDFDSNGICFLDLCDRYIANIHGKKYNCVLFNDDIKITQGLEESVYTDMPETSETDYTKADKTDQRINKAYIIMDKVNRRLESVISETSEHAEKIAEIEQDVDSINQKISNIQDLTRESTGINQVNLQNTAKIEGAILELSIHGNMNFAFPSTTLYPSTTSYPIPNYITLVIDKQNRNVISSEAKQININLKEPLRTLNNTYDELIIIESACKVIRRIGVNANGTLYILSKETTQELGQVVLPTFDTETYIYILQHNNLNYYCKYIIDNDYIKSFATKAELDSSKKQTAEEITNTVNQRLEGYSSTEEVNSKIQQTANSITNTVSQNYATKTELATTKTEIKQTTDSITSTVSKKVGENEIISKINQSAETVGIDATKISLSASDILNLLAGNTINLTSKNIVISANKFSVDKNGKLTCSDIDITGGKISLTTNSNDKTIFRVMESENTDQMAYITPYVIGMNGQGIGGAITLSTLSGLSPYIEVSNGYRNTNISGDGITTPILTQRSKESVKKNIEKYNENAINIVKNSEIYIYNFKDEKDTDKKHVGFVIGDKGGDYKTPEQVISDNNEGINNYDMTSILWKAVQELTLEVEKLKGGQVDE